AKIAIDGIKQQMDEKINEIRRAEKNVSSIERECAKNPKTIEKLREEQQKSKERQRQASYDKEYYAKFVQEEQDTLFPLHKQTAKLRIQKKELSESFDQCMKEHKEYESEKESILISSFADHLRVPRAAEESSGRKD
ncbi:MAG TPA: hypothetical protein VHV10_05475, partial [Ktedonobacteraceae bacterium]|nr:hypothetical protein [Ktedonobacteraceae bacterium]